MERNVKYLLLTKTDVLKTSIFLQRKFEKCANFEEQNGTSSKVYSRERLYWYYCLHHSYVYKTVSQISFKLFCSGDKRLLSEFLPKLG